MYDSSDLRKGLKIDIDGEPYIITEFQFSKPGKGQALYRCKLKNMITGFTMDRTYRSGDKFKPADLEEVRMQYLYRDGEGFHFMNTKTYDQVTMREEALGEARNFLMENMEVDVLLFQGQPIDITLPNFVELTVTRADPGVRGDTATGATKPVTLETGYEVQVPLFIEEGEVVRIDTRTGAYVERVKK
ncbi:elongation factor P [Dissulfurirhabdus thermomarina]|uniref:Elongation factor P n=1 Tax=Dissulfurirhabdus thermomarina TaxID=1765737 RepID=A0A6N9TTN7_DISTH|nr:elongation factor P [Dissulfurirhabdus thermomarina]NDY41866.1 elongation factor P [Dissulfurirhabdus thermomarina]NMX22567.1 elongation factor P [Dissulfurirhabdus thermomarina]